MQRTGWVTSMGHRLAFVAANEHLASDAEPPLVFIHGVLASVHFWSPLLPSEILQQRTWYSLSLPAHHPSTTPDDFSTQVLTPEWFFQLFDGALKGLLGARQAIVIGHSTGGFSALNLAIHGADNVLGVVSVAGFHRGQWGGVEGALVKLAGMGAWTKPLFMANLALSRRLPSMQQFFARQLAYQRDAYEASPLSANMLQAIASDVRQHKPLALFHLFHGIHHLAIAERLADIRVPCYLFVGTHDPVVPAEQSLQLAGSTPGAHLVVFSEVGHMPFIEATADFQAALMTTIKQLSPTAVS